MLLLFLFQEVMNSPFPKYCHTHRHILDLGSWPHHVIKGMACKSKLIAARKMYLTECGTQNTPACFHSRGPVEGDRHEPCRAARGSAHFSVHLIFPARGPWLRESPQTDHMRNSDSLGVPSQPQALLSTTTVVLRSSRKPKESWSPPCALLRPIVPGPTAGPRLVNLL